MAVNTPMIASNTQASASYTLELAEYEPVPETLQRELCAAFRRDAEEG